MDEWISRTALLLGEDTCKLLADKHVMIVGVGGVGAYAAEMVARAGVGTLTVIDADTVKASNINRQLLALSDTIGQEKATLMQERLLRICPTLQVHALSLFIDPDNIPAVMAQYQPDFVIDAIDSIAPKIALITYCIQRGVRIISSMGAGGRIDPTALRYADISQTSYCSLARTVRSRLKANGIYKGLPVVYSIEPANKEAVIKVDDERNKCTTVGTISYLPALFGCYLASYCIKKLIET
ncbi:MAG: tRNA threonylcarbamoyladenosine dehydratase [Paludibacteraceae bacterium]|nr:tRNA threonylcarbamoyladenosine dehydratase [Paludibacteraceae bacterium]